MNPLKTSLLSLLAIGSLTAAENGFSMKRVCRKSGCSEMLAEDLYGKFISSISRVTLMNVTDRELEEMYIEWLSANVTRHDILKSHYGDFEYEFE